MDNIKLNKKATASTGAIEKGTIEETHGGSIETLPPSYDDATEESHIRGDRRVHSLHMTLRSSTLRPPPARPLSVVLSDCESPPSTTHADTTATPKWLTRNFLAAGIMICSFWALAPVLLAFGGVIKDDLKDDPFDYTCDSDYIKDASVPWPGSTAYDAPGRYHMQCRQLYACSLVILVGGSLSLVRAFLQIFAIGHKQVWGYRSRVVWIYGARGILSGISCSLYIASAVMLGTSPLLTGPIAAPGDDYVIMYTVCTILLSLAAAMHLHDAVCCGNMVVRLRRW